jgi:pantoate--beta-alanine ligase
MNIEIVAGDIIREEDGIAMSSRNTYLNDNQRESALSLSRSLTMAKGAVENGETNPAVIQDHLKSFIESFSETNIDYISFCDPITLEPVDIIDRQIVLALAVKVGKTRLIDNMIISPENS